jgi:hypothetical protein
MTSNLALAMSLDARTTIRTLALWRVYVPNLDTSDAAILGYMLDTYGVCR